VRWDDGGCDGVTVAEVLSSGATKILKVISSKFIIIEVCGGLVSDTGSATGVA